MNRITTVWALGVLLLGSIISTAPAQAAATAKKQAQTCVRCATSKVSAAKAGAAKATVRLTAAASTSCCTGGSCCPECPTCCQNNTCNTGKCPNGCCNTSSCQPGVSCCK